MATVVECPGCVRNYQLPALELGQRFRCPHCRLLMVMSERGIKPASYAIEGQPRPGAGRSQRRRRDRDDYDDYDGRGGAGRTVAWLVVGFLVVAGAAVALLAAFDWGRDFGSGGGEPFDRVREGMTQAEVVRLMGPPTATFPTVGGGPGGLTSSVDLVWEKAPDFFEVRLVNGKVKEKRRERLREGGR
jgi:hypothetical protein